MTMVIAAIFFVKAPIPNWSHRPCQYSLPDSHVRIPSPLSTKILDGYQRKHSKLSFLFFVAIYIFIHFRYYVPLYHVEPFLPIGLGFVALELIHVLFSLLGVLAQGEGEAEPMLLLITAGLAITVIHYFRKCVDATRSDLPEIMVVPPLVSFATSWLAYGFLPPTRLDRQNSATIVHSVSDEETHVGNTEPEPGVGRN
ncbi:hypothetical protein PM082_022438 [Marasmius tenuissimus]|nr:hypothetical protein PM082_022438 [Marasmius tenuissimus]